MSWESDPMFVLVSDSMNVAVCQCLCQGITVSCVCIDLCLCMCPGSGSDWSKAHRGSAAGAPLQTTS